MHPEPDHQSLDRLAAALSERPGIQLAYAFGSAVDDMLHAGSDFDLAVLAPDGPLEVACRTEVIRLVANLTGRPVDLVDLSTAGVVVLRSVLGNGRQLVCKSRQAHEQLLTRLLVDTEDFLPYRERMLRERREAWIG